MADLDPNSKEEQPGSVPLCRPGHSNTSPFSTWFAGSRSFPADSMAIPGIGVLPGHAYAPFLQRNTRYRSQSPPPTRELLSILEKCIIRFTLSDESLTTNRRLA